VRRYRPQWELLADALKRIQSANGVTEEEAKIDLCRALGDGKVRIKIRVSDAAPMRGEHVFVLSQSVTPAQLDGNDQTRSRPP
jgi:hypothetical protein